MAIYISIKIHCIEKELLKMSIKDNIGIISFNHIFFLVIPDKTKKEAFINCLSKFRFRNSDYVNSMLLPMQVGYFDQSEICRVFSNIEILDEPRISTCYVVADIRRSFNGLNTGIEEFEV
jgi:hypothetical protein